MAVSFSHNGSGQVVDIHTCASISKNYSTAVKFRKTVQFDNKTMSSARDKRIEEPTAGQCTQRTLSLTAALRCWSCSCLRIMARSTSACCQSQHTWNSY